MIFSRVKSGVLAGATRVVIAVAFLLLITFSEAGAQSRRAQIRVVSVTPARVQIELELPVATDELSFLNAYGGVLGLGDRIELLRVSHDGRNLEVRRLGPGEYKSETKFTQVSYQVSLPEPARPSHMSLVTSLNGNQGLLMLADLLPRAKDARETLTNIRIEAPNSWTVVTNIPRKGAEYSTSNPESGVFLIGPAVREKGKSDGSTNLSVATSGQWSFSGSDALKVAGNLVKEYSIVTGHALKTNSMVFLVPFPGDVGPERWSAETRGNAVILLMGRQASEKRVLAMLGIVLSHELFHLWVPNALGLDGNYDWFFEGFTLYQALKTDLKLGMISFATFFKTLAKVYDSYLNSADRDRLSLIEASERRWTTSSSLVYDKGMLVAFIYDLILSDSSGCQVSLNDVYRNLFQRGTRGHESANETIIKILAELVRTESVGKDYIEGHRQVDLVSLLAPHGIRVSPGTKGTRLDLAEKLTPVQRKTLECIGYQD